MSVKHVINLIFLAIIVGLLPRLVASDSDKAEAIDRTLFTSLEIDKIRYAVILRNGKAVLVSDPQELGQLEDILRILPPRTEVYPQVIVEPDAILILRSKNCHLIELKIYGEHLHLGSDGSLIIRATDGSVADATYARSINKWIAGVGDGANVKVVPEQ